MSLRWLSVLLLVANTALAQDPTFNITDLFVPASIPQGGKDRKTFESISWFIPDLKTDQFDTIDTSVELMAGASEGQEVVDIILFNEKTHTSTNWYIPSNLPTGDYHVRLNTSIVPLGRNPSDMTIVYGDPVATFSIRSKTINVTPREAQGCIQPRSWESFKTVAGSSSPNYTSLILAEPFAGTNVVNRAGDTEFIRLLWGWRNGENSYFNEGVSGLSFQLKKAEGGENVGPAATPDLDKGLFSGAFASSIPFSNHTVEEGVRYRLAVKYTNKFLDQGGSGKAVVFDSPEFEVAFTNTTCANTKLTTTSGPSATRTGTGATSPTSTGSRNNGVASRGATAHFWAMVVVACGILCSSVAASL